MAGKQGGKETGSRRPRVWARDHPIVLLFAITVLLATGVNAILLLFNPPLQPTSVRAEVTKAFIQLTVVAVGAAVVAGAVSAIEANRERRDQAARDREVNHRLEVDFLMRWLREATDAYNEVKSVRRAFEHVPGNPPVLNESHDGLIQEQIQVLNEAQLTFESLRRVMRVRGRAHELSSDPVNGLAYEGLERCMRQMEGYVEDIVAEARKDLHRSGKFVAFLGPVNDVGGIRMGPVTRYKRKSEESSGLGPSAQLRQAEMLIAGLIPIGPVPATPSEERPT